MQLASQPPRDDKDHGPEPPSVKLAIDSMNHLQRGWQHLQWMGAEYSRIVDGGANKARVMLCRHLAATRSRP